MQHTAITVQLTVEENFMAQMSPKLFPAVEIGTRITTCAIYLLLASLPVLRAQAPPNDLQKQNLQSQMSSSPLSAGSVTPFPAPEGVADMKLAPGSLIDVRVFEESDLDGSYRLDNDGQISMPLAGTIHLGSLTLAEAAAVITAKLETAQILKTPHVSVNIEEYSTHYIVVLGEVASPGRFPVMGQRKLTDVLAMAGGETQAAGNEIVIHRFQNPPNVTETVHYGYGRDGNNPAVLDVEIDPGDAVLVKRAGLVYVLGAVVRPGGYPMQEAGKLNIDQALALAEGTLAEAKVKRVLVLRKLSDGTYESFVVNYKKLNSGEAYPPQLKPEDIVYVPVSHWKFSLLHVTQVAGGVAAAIVYRAP